MAPKHFCLFILFYLLWLRHTKWCAHINPVEIYPQLCFPSFRCFSLLVLMNFVLKLGEAEFSNRNRSLWSYQTQIVEHIHSENDNTADVLMALSFPANNVAVPVTGSDRRRNASSMSASVTKVCLIFTTSKLNRLKKKRQTRTFVDVSFHLLRKGCVSGSQHASLQSLGRVWFILLIRSVLSSGRIQSCP